MEQSPKEKTSTLSPKASRTNSSLGGHLTEELGCSRRCPSSSYFVLSYRYLSSLPLKLKYW